MNIKKYIPKQTKQALKNFYYFAKVAGKPKVFCISMQRSGTTSVGQFLKDHGYRVAVCGHHSKDWSKLYRKGDYDRIFKSLEFKSHQAFEDNPWWFPDFYRVLHCKFPNAKFILLYRDSDKWFNSLAAHGSIRKLANSYGHNKIYRKLDIFYDKLDNDPNFRPNEYDEDNSIPFETCRDRYIKVYEEHNREVIEYFRQYAPDKLFTARLEDKNKWKRLGEFLGVEVDDNYDVHTNKTEELPDYKKYYSSEVH